VKSAELTAGAFMISKCANPKCEVDFHYLRGGKLYRFDIRRPKEPCPDLPNAILAQNPSKTTVYFWLCEKCSQVNTVQFSLTKGMKVQPIARSSVRFGPVVVKAVDPDRALLAEESQSVDPHDPKSLARNRKGEAS